MPSKKEPKPKKPPVESLQVERAGDPIEDYVLLEEPVKVVTYRYQKREITGLRGGKIKKK